MINDENELYDNVEEFTLLGVDFESHQKQGIKWDNYIHKCIKKAYNKMWILKRLAEKGVSSTDLLMTFISRIRSQLEQNVPLWHFTISKRLSNDIEKVQKACLFIILGRKATSSYGSNLALLNLNKLKERRDELCQNFAKKVVKHPVHRNMFTWKKGSKTRKGDKVIVPKYKTKRYGTSSIPSLARIINSM